MRGVFEQLKHKKPWEAGPAGIFLAGLSYVYRAIISLRAFLYRTGLLSIETVDGIKVISIGNITVGGTGKTPVTVMLARLIKEQGLATAVVSRGYGRRSEEEVQIVADTTGIRAEFPQAADEALVTAKALPGTPVICAPRRAQGVKAVRDEHGTKVVVLDDAFSHFAIARGLDIVLIDATNPFGNGWLFPAGPLREPLSSLARADAFLITRANLVGDERLADLRTDLARFGKPIFTADIVPDVVIDKHGTTRKADDFLQGKDVALVSGIGSPEQFEATVKDLGATVLGHKVFPDHHPYDDGQLRFAIAPFAEKTVLTTEKDFVRMPYGLQEKFCRLSINAVVREEAELAAFIKTFLNK